MDFATIAGSDYLMITSRDGKSVYFCATGTDTVFGRIILVGAIISLIFAVVLTVLLIVLLRGYNEETYREWEVLRAKERERVKQRYAQRGDKRGRAEDVEGKTAILRKLRALIGWNQKSAGEKAVFVFRIGMIVFILCALETLNGKALPNESYGTMLGFFMKGSWMRGLNLFSVCSILSLALSLGAQDLIKDILAGLAIVFDGSFHLGDVVEIGGTAGVVQEIGVRATKLTVEGNNTLYINNSEISRVLNKSREPSILKLELRISAKESLLKLEELLKRELPEIGSRNSKIKKGPILLGVTGLSGTMYTSLLKLAIEVMIDQKDEGAVTTYLYREIRLLCEREGIELL